MSVRYDLGTVLQGSEGMRHSQICLHFKFFPNSVREGGNQISIFSKIQNSPNHPRGGGGVKKVMDFFHILGHFVF